MQFLIVIVVLFAVMWLLIIRPQRKRQLEQQRLLQNVAPGEEILTAGGLYGRVSSVTDDDLMLEIAPGTEIRLAKRAVAAVIRPPEEDEYDELEDAGEAGEKEGGDPELAEVVRRARTRRR